MKGRKAELRRLAAKRGWDDGREGNECNPDTKLVMKSFANGFKFTSSPDEAIAYWNGYEEGKDAGDKAVNPYSNANNIK